MVAVIVRIYCCINFCQFPLLFGRNIQMRKKRANASSITCNINDTNGIIPKKPSNMRAIAANIYARIFEGVMKIKNKYTYFIIP